MTIDIEALRNEVAMVLQKNVNGIRNINIVDFIYNNLELFSGQ